MGTILRFFRPKNIDNNKCRTCGMTLGAAIFYHSTSGKAPTCVDGEMSHKWD